MDTLAYTPHSSLPLSPKRWQRTYQRHQRLKLEGHGSILVSLTHSRGNHMFSSLFKMYTSKMYTSKMQKRSKDIRNKPLQICTKRSSANFIQKWRSRATKGKSNAIVWSPQNKKKETPTTSLTFVYSLLAFATIILPASLRPRTTRTVPVHQSGLWRKILWA